MRYCPALKPGLLLFAILALASCAKPVPERVEPSGPLLPESVYTEAQRQGENVYRISKQQSYVLIRVGRAGRMKNLGHEHVVASEDVEGHVLIADDPAESRADLLIPLELLIVDKPAYRQEMGLEGEMTESAIDGTTTNMHKVLESAEYPVATISARFATPQSDSRTLDVSITLHGMTSDYVVPVDMQMDADRLVIKGEFTMLHSDFGLTPFSAAGGLVKVAEEMKLQFMLVATRV